MTIKELREELAKLAARIAELRKLSDDDKHDWSGEDEEAWTRVNAAYDELKRKLDIAVKDEEVRRFTAAAASDPRVGREDRDGRDDPHDDPRDRRPRTVADEPDEETRVLALQGWMLAGSHRSVSDRHAEAMRVCRIRPGNELTIPLGDTRRIHRAAETFRNAHPSLAEQRALSAFLGSSGGATVPEGFINSLEVNMLAYGGMMQVAQMLRTTGGEDLPWPTADDTSNTGELVGESANVATEADPSFGQVVFKAYKFSSKLVKVPSELMQDSAFDLAAELGRMLGERLGRVLNTKFTTGHGGAEPRGIVTAASLGVTAAAVDAITADEILELVHSIDPAYRTGGRFMMHDNTLLHLRKLKDGNGQYLWSSGLGGGVPDTLAGYPITVNQDMASALATSAKTVLFGQLSKYKVREVRGMTLRRLTELYAANDQEGFIAFLRADGNLLDAGTAPVKYIQQA